VWGGSGRNGCKVSRSTDCKGLMAATRSQKTTLFRIRLHIRVPIAAIFVGASGTGAFENDAHTRPSGDEALPVAARTFWISRMSGVEQISPRTCGHPVTNGGGNNEFAEFPCAERASMRGARLA
jgi:hypothetical protein